MAIRQICGVLALVMLSCIASGCGKAPPADSPDGKQTRSIEAFKKDLQLVAEYGTGGSALQPIAIDIASLDAAFPERAELEKKSKALEAAKSDDDRKKIAKEMLGLLGAK